MGLTALFEHVTLDPEGRRIAIPKQFADRILPNTTAGTANFWLWFVSPGQYRLLSDDQVGSDPQLESLRSIMDEEWSKPSAAATYAQPPEMTAMVARLVRVEIATSKSCRRLSLPIEFAPFVPADCEKRALTVVLSPEGFLEIWYTDALRRAVFSSSLPRT